jgi:hypothetical protein
MRAEVLRDFKIRSIYKATKVRILRFEEEADKFYEFFGVEVFKKKQ